MDLIDACLHLPNPKRQWELLTWVNLLSTPCLRKSCIMHQSCCRRCPEWPITWLHLLSTDLSQYADLASLMSPRRFHFYPSFLIQEWTDLYFISRDKTHTFCKKKYWRFIFFNWTKSSRNKLMYFLRSLTQNISPATRSGRLSIAMQNHGKRISIGDGSIIRTTLWLVNCFHALGNGEFSWHSTIERGTTWVRKQIVSYSLTANFSVSFFHCRLYFLLYNSCISAPKPPKSMI